ncbi:hypothetical protein LINPERPRIM_LOCUS20194 [Linum perenne]
MFFNAFSKFRDIYDQEFFFTALQNEVRVVDKIPGCCPPSTTRRKESEQAKEADE